MRFDIADNAFQIAVAHKEFVVRFVRHHFQHGIAVVVFIKIDNVFARAHGGSYLALLHIENVFNQIVFLFFQHTSLRTGIDDGVNVFRSQLFLTDGGNFEELEYCVCQSVKNQNKRL